ncbi:MAG: hypothetical protein JO218_17705 [Burkholderiales bacterium]|nr:hypothetical protein [Burkholderiales bacterium]
MQRLELRLSGALMSSLAALVIAHGLPKLQLPKHGHVPDPARLDGTGIVLASIPVVLNVMMWLSGGILPEELTFVASLTYAIIFALPHWFAAGWLADTPFQKAHMLYQAMVLLWMAHLLVCTVFEIKGIRWAHKVLGVTYIEREPEQRVPPNPEEPKP